MPRSYLFCAGLLAMFTAVAWFATAGKSPTYDEPYHGISSWLQLRYHDYRLDYQDPPLWQYWASLANSRNCLRANFTDPAWLKMPYNVVSQWYWGVNTLYRTRGNDAIAFMNHCRAMMLPLATLLGVLICCWTRRLAGAWASVIATFCFCADPNFLAHSALMKNDVVFSLSMFALAMGLWSAGKKITLVNFTTICLLCVATLTIKFTGVVAVMLVPILLGLRAVLPGEWRVGRFAICSRPGRLLVAAGMTLVCATVSWIGIWAVYGFRFTATPDPKIFINLTEITDRIRVARLIAQSHGAPPPGSLPSTDLPWTTTLALFGNQHGLFPQAYIAGFLFTYTTALVRYTYALGQYSIVGWLWYFPFTILVKTPLATLLMIGLAAVWLMRRRTQDRQTQWSILCVGVPIVLFLGTAMSSDLNIGLRHVLPIYPFLFVALGWILSAIWQSQHRKWRSAIAAMGLMLVIETACNYPDFIPFFNVLATQLAGSRLVLLGDSNLDWGQDLPLLARWQHDNPDVPLYLCYFGDADPAYFGIRYIPLPGGYRYDPRPHFPDPYARSILAISATNLQGILLDATLRKYYSDWARRKPLAVLGGSIYLYEYDPTLEAHPKVNAVYGGD